MRSEDAPEIRALPLFRSMAAEAFADLVRGAYLQTIPPQIELIREGGRPDFLHVLVEGHVELHAGWGPRSTTMAVLAPVTTFILAATITDRPYLMSARTLGPCRVALIPTEDVRRSFALDRDFARAIVTELALGFRRAIRHTKDLKLRSALERLANYLLRRDAETGGTGRFDLPFEKRLLASLLGMTPENLSRAFAGLRAYGVEAEGSRIRLADREALDRLARPSALIDAPETWEGMPVPATSF